MLRKIFMLAAAMFLIAPQVFAEAGFFVSLCTDNESDNLGDFSSYYDQYQPVGWSTFKSYSPDANSGSLFKIGAFYEESGLFKLSDKNSFGLSVSYETIKNRSMSYEIKDAIYDFRYNLSSGGYKIPVLVYYKYKLNGSFFVKGGIGATYVLNKWDENYGTFSGGKTYDIIMPQIDAGIELAFSRFISVCIDGSYAFNGKIEPDCKFPAMESFKLEKDFSGFSAEISLKVYILPRKK